MSNKSVSATYMARVGHAVEVGQWPEEILVNDGRGRDEGGGNGAEK